MTSFAPGSSSVAAFASATTARDNPVAGSMFSSFATSPVGTMVASSRHSGAASTRSLVSAPSAVAVSSGTISASARPSARRNRARISVTFVPFGTSAVTPANADRARARSALTSASSCSPTMPGSLSRRTRLPVMSRASARVARRSAWAAANAERSESEIPPPSTASCNAASLALTSASDKRSRAPMALSQLFAT